MRSGSKGAGLGLGILLEAAREARILEKAVKAAREELKKELAIARKAVKSNSYCWRTKDVAREFEVDASTVKRWRKRLGLPWKRNGKRGVSFRPGDVRRWAAQRKEG